MATIAIMLSSCQSKNYKVQISEGDVSVTMHSPTIGIVGINKVGYDGFTLEEVEEEIFDGIRRKGFNGDYNVYVTLQYKDDHGNYYNGDRDYNVYVTLQYKDDHGNYYNGDRVKVSTLNGADVKEYASYSYFRGNAHLYAAFPWNRK
jgi:hypothetical protein